MLEGTGGDTVIQAFLQIAVEQTMNQAGRKGIARAKPIDYFYLISARMQDPAILVSDGGPAILPDQRVLAQSDGDNLEREAVGDPGGGLLVVFAGDAKDSFDVFLGGDKNIAELHQVGHTAAGLG